MSDRLNVLSAEQRAVVERAVASLQNVTGVRAIVLGGSYATGRNRSDSDIDLAIFTIRIA